MNVRTIRWALLSLGFVVFVAVIWSVATHEPPRAAPEDPATDMGQDVVMAEDKPRLTRHEGEESRTEALGSRMEVDKYGRQVWRDFDLSQKLEDGRTVRVKADSARYDARSGDFEVEGHVVVETSDGHRLAGNRLSHKADPGKKQDVYESAEPMEFARPDVSGKAGTVRADMATRLFDLGGGVTFVVDRGKGEEKVRIEGPRAVHDDVQRHGRFPEGATVTQGESTLKADALEVALAPKGEKGIRSVLARGNVLVNRRAAAPVEPAAKASGAFTGAQSLQADVVNVEYGADGRDVERAVALRGATPASFHVVPEDPTQGPRDVQADQIEVLYAGGEPAKVIADGDVVVTVAGVPPEAGKTVTCSRAEAALLDGDVDAIAFTGQVVIVDGARTAKGDRATYARSTETMAVLAADPGKGQKAEVVEGDSVLKAHAIESRRKEDLLLADGEVELTYADKGEKKEGLEGLLGKSRDPVRVLAGNMRSQQRSGEAVFEKDVRLWKGKTVIEAPLVTVRRDGKELVAERGAKAVMEQAGEAVGGGAKEPVRIEAWKIVLDDVLHKVTCEPGAGDVKLRQGDALITGQDATFELDPDTSSVRRALISGGVTIADGKRNGKGDRVTYDVVHGRRVVLKGSDVEPARLEAVARGSTRGEELIFYLDEDLVSVAGGRVDTTLELGTGGGLAGSNAPR